MDNPVNSTSVATTDPKLPIASTQVPVPEGASKVASEGAEKAAIVTPPERTYSQSEWTKMQSAKDKEVKLAQEARDKVAAETAAETRRLMDELQQERERGYLKYVEEAGGNLDAAKTQLQRERVARQKEFELADRERRVSEQMAKADAVARLLTAKQLITDNHLDPSVEEELLEMPDAVQMENRALRLALTQSKVEQKPVVKVDKGAPAQAPVDYSKQPPISVLGKLAQDAYEKNKK